MAKDPATGLDKDPKRRLAQLSNQLKKLGLEKGAARNIAAKILPLIGAGAGAAAGGGIPWTLLTVLGTLLYGGGIAKDLFSETRQIDLQRDLLENQEAAALTELQYQMQQDERNRLDARQARREQQAMLPSLMAMQGAKDDANIEMARVMGRRNLAENMQLSRGMGGSDFGELMGQAIRANPRNELEALGLV